MDSEGNVRYDTIAQQGHAPGKIIQSQFKDLVPLAHRKDLDESSHAMDCPSEEEVQVTADKMSDVVEDPLEPPRFKHKKIPKGPPSLPPPVLRSPPRAAEQKEWMILPCISNWKNNKGFTIPLDKRLAADGRGLQDVSW